MIVLGADTHKRSHTIAAVSSTSGEQLGEQTVQSGAKGAAALLRWARGLGNERVWAIEDCRHVSGSLERFLIERGERVLRVHSTLMSASRRQARGRGKSDGIDALAVAPGRVARRPGHVAGSTPRRARARLAAPSRSPGTAGSPAGRDQQHAAMASARPLVRNAVPWERVVLRHLGTPDRPPARPRRPDDARPDRPRRAAPHPRALPDDQGARGRDRRTWSPRSPRICSPSPALAHSPRPSWSARSPARIASPATQSSHAPRASPRSRSAPARPTGTGSIAAATARSTRPSIASPSPACAATPKARTTSPANATKARAPRKPSAASSAPHPPRLAPAPDQRPRPEPDDHTINLLT
jgi:hypothetical protein